MSNMNSLPPVPFNLTHMNASISATTLANSDYQQTIQGLLLIIIDYGTGKLPSHSQASSSKISVMDYKLLLHW